MQHEITALKQQKRDHQRVNVYLDGEFAFGLTRIVAAWLEVGQKIGDEKIAQLRTEESREKAYQRAINYLSYRPRSETEIRRNLVKNDVSDNLIEDVLERLRQSGLVNDAEFAQAWVENRSEMRPRGQRALAYELRQRGIDHQIIDQTLESVDEGEQAYRAALMRVRRFKNLEWNDFRKKMCSYLAQRGFNYHVAAPAIDRVWAEAQGTDQKSDEEATL